MPTTLALEVSGALLPATRWGDPEGPLFLLLHAGVGDRRSWAAVAPLLLEAGGVMAYDRRGFGEADVPTEPFSHLEDLLDVLDLFQDDDFEREIWLVGSSKGGGLALEAALARPELLTGVIALAPGLNGEPAPPPTEPGDHSDDFDEAFEAAIAAGDLETANRIDVRFWLDGTNSPEGRVGGPARELALDMNAIIYRNDVPDDLERDRPPAWPHAAEITVPVTIAAGDLDVPGLVAVHRQLAGLISGARWTDLPGTAHLPYLENPQLVAATILAAVRAARPEPHPLSS